MQAGDLDRLITIQRKTEARDGSGQVLPVWESFAANIWAGIEYVDGNESFSDPTRRDKQNVKFRIRFLSGVQARMRVLHNGQVFEIADVAELKRREGLLLTAYSIDPQSGSV